MAEHAPPGPPTPRAHVGQRVFAALTLAAAGEGVVTSVLTVAHGGGAADALIGWFVTVGLLLPVVALGTALSWGLFGRDAATRFFMGLTSTLGGSPRAGSVAIVMLAVAFGLALFGAQAVGVRFIQNMSDRFAALATALLALGLLPVAIGLTGLLGRPLGRALTSPALRRVRFLAHPTTGFVLLGIGAGLVIARSLDWNWIVLPVSFLVGLAARPLRRSSVLGGLLVAATGLGVASWPLLGGSLPRSVGSVLRTGPPYAGLLIRAVESRFDEDEDGYARPPIGLDCDDRDDAINPGARDEPGNGIDENCNGSDGIVYELPPAPPVERPAGIPDQPNIVLLMLDTLRPDHTGFGGYERDVTPNLDAFRETATLFTHARTTSVGSMLSLTSIFTGYYVQGLDITVVPGRTTVEPSVSMIAELLQRRGYATAGYTIPHFFHVSRGLEQGFQTFESPWPIDEWAEYFGRSDPETTDAAIAFLEHRPEDRPFFLFGHYRCAHGPYTRHPEHDFGSDSVAQYDSSAASCDEHVGRLLDVLNEPALRDNTAIIIFSDHGEELGYRGHEYHGSSLYEPAIRTVLLLRVPGADLPSSVDAPVVLTDINPTIRQIAGIDRPRSLHGWSLFTYTGGTDAAELPDRPLFFFTGHIGRISPVMIRGLYDQGYMYLRDTQNGTAELYDMREDPAQETDLSERDPVRASQMSELLDGLFEHVSQPVE